MKNNRSLSLVVDALLLISIAVLYTWSIFAAQLESTLGFDHVQTSAVFTVSICSYCGGSLLAGVLSKYVRMSFVLLIAAIFLSGGFALSGLFGTLWSYMIGYGLLSGAGVGMVYNAVLCDCARRFPDKSGLSSGILLMSYSFGALLFSHVSAALIVRFELQSVFLRFAVFELIILLAGALFSHLIPVPCEAKFSGNNTEANSSKAGISPVAMIRMRSFYLIFFWLMIISASALTVIGSTTLMVQAAGFTPQVGTLLTGLVSFIGAFGRLGFGQMFDKHGHSATVRADGFLITCSAVFMLIALLCHLRIAFIIGLLLLGFSFGGMSSICAALVNHLYGLQYYAQNLSIVSLQMIPASLLGPMIASTIYDRTESYLFVFVVVLALSLLANVIGYKIDR